MSNITIREIRDDEIELLDDFLYEAIFIPAGVEMPPRSIIEKDELRVYVDSFGFIEGDYCLVAIDGEKVIGAVWTRFMHDYGYVDADTLSLAISLYKEYRGQGIGTRLMIEIIKLLKKEGYSRLSLAVQKANYAVRLYKKVGFKTIKETEEEYIMLCEF